VKEVATGMGYDKRIGSQFLEAGVGYGGSCFPKDVRALAHMANVHGRHPQLLEAVMDINDYQRRLVVSKVEELLGSLKGKVVGILGLAFKQNTDDMREAPAITVANHLHDHGAIVRGYDPVAAENAAKDMPYMQMMKNSYELAQDADALIVMTPWNEFKHLDMDRIRGTMKHPILIDGRNLYDPKEMTALGFQYRGIGRGYNHNNGGEGK
jgi:UDPglucose 6-dehydrogenase